AETVFAAQERALALRRAGKSSEAATLLFAPELIQTRNDMDAAAKDLIARTNKLEEDANAARQATEDRAKMVAVTLIVAGIGLGLVVAFLIARSIAGSVTQMVELIREVANNNLTAEDMKVASEDEIGQAGKALNRMKNNLHETIQSIAASAMHVAAASEE